MYGRVRLGGTIGWGLMAPLAGLIIQSYGIRWAFWGYAIIMLLVFIVSQKFTFGKTGGKCTLQQGYATNCWLTGVGIFPGLAFVGGVAFTSINNYLFPYMEEAGNQPFDDGYRVNHRHPR